MRTPTVPWRHLAAVGLVLGVVQGAASPAAGGGAAPPGVRQPEVSATDLPAGIHWRDLNNRGQVLGLRPGPTPEDARTVVWDDGELVDIGPHELPPNPCGPARCPYFAPGGESINDRGQVVTYQDGGAVLWQDGQRTSLTGDADTSWILDLNERGEVLLLRFTGNQQVVGVWRRGTFTPVHSGPLEWTAGLLSERGHVVVNRLDPGCCAGFVWHRGVRHDLPGSGVAVNRSGQVAGEARDPDTGVVYPYVWDQGEVRRLPASGADRVVVTDINDRGQVVGTLGPPVGPAGGYSTVLWDENGVTDIGADTEIATNEPSGINNRGDVLIRGRNGTVLLWRRGELVPLTAPDDPLTAVEPVDLNERGQALGLRWLDVTSALLWQVSG